MASGKIIVRFGQMASPLTVSNIKEGTTLETYLKSRSLEFNASIRLNGKPASRTAVLKNNDIILTINAVSGGVR